MDVRKLEINDFSRIVLENGTIILPQTIVTDNKEQKILISTIITGDVNLFRGYSDLVGECFFINCKDNLTIKRINPLNPQAFLYTYFKNCDESKRREISYNSESLQSAIAYFSQCNHYEISKIETPKTDYSLSRVSVGVRLAAGNSQPKITGWFGNEYSSSSNIGVGLAFRINFTQSFSTSIGLNYFSKQFDSKDSIYNFNIVSIKALPKVGYSIFEMPLECNYRFSQLSSSLNPTITLGASMLYMTNLKVEGDFSKRNATPLYDLSASSFNTSFINFSFYIAGSISRILNEKSYIDIGLKYAQEKEDFTNAITKTTTYPSNQLTTINSSRIELFLLYFYRLGKKKR